MDERFVGKAHMISRIKHQTPANVYVVRSSRLFPCKEVQSKER